MNEKLKRLRQLAKENENLNSEQFNIRINTINLPCIDLTFTTKITKNGEQYRQKKTYKNEYIAPPHNKRIYNLTKENLNVFREMESLNNEIDVIKNKLCNIINKLK